jgi:hypothetical protein
LASLAVQSYQCPSMFIRGSSGPQHFISFPEFQMPFLGEPFTGMPESGKVVF